MPIRSCLIGCILTHECLRNGGHVNPPLYHDYNDLKQKFGERAAKQMIKFRLAHLQEFMHIATSEDIVKESQCRETEHIDVFTCPVSFAEAKDNLVKWKSEMPVEASSFGYCEGRDAIEVRLHTREGKGRGTSQSTRAYFNHGFDVCSLS